MNIQPDLLKRSLEENIRELYELSPIVPHSMLLINYNSLMDDFYKGSITAEMFQVRQSKLWESLFFFTGKLKETDQQAVVNGQPATSTGKKAILYISATPTNVDNLQVDFEFKKIRASLEGGLNRDEFELLSPLMAVSLQDFLQAKHRYKPAIIHFSGHGLQDGLMFATSENVFQIIPTELLKEVFKGIEAYAKLIVLNACYSSAQAKILSEKGIYVLGMNVPVTDTAAIDLADNLYRFISDGQTTEEAFVNVKILIALNFPAEAETLEMWKNGKLLKI